MLEVSPVRKAKREVQHLKFKKKQQPILQNKNITLMEVDLNDSFDKELLELDPVKPTPKRFKTDVTKDKFSQHNKS
jgi:hypothetical protein